MDEYLHCIDDILEGAANELNGSARMTLQRAQASLRELGPDGPDPA